MNNLKTFIFLYLAITCTNTFCQNYCSDFNRISDSCNRIFNKKRIEPNADKKKALYQKYKELSYEAAILMKHCMETNRFPRESENSLKSTFLYASNLYNAGKCDEANTAFSECLNSPYASMKKNEKETYATLISRYLNRCKAPLLSETAVSGAYILEYDGKSGAFIAELYNNNSVQALLNNDPLTTDEQEEIMLRAVSRSDSSDLPAIALKLSGNPDFVYRYPFLLLRDTTTFLKKRITQEKNVDSKEDPAADPLLADFSDFIYSRYTYLTKTFFNKFNPGDKLITCYLIGGKYNKEGLESYLRFSNKIHFRAQKQVAYYMNSDNSIVAWTSSGGGTLIHEMIHAIINADFKNIPFWLNEGMASLFEETYDIRPIDNYRIIFIQQAFNNKKCFIKLQDLFAADKYPYLSEDDYNLVNSGARYFCKFIYDKFGVEKLVQVYQQLRSLSDLAPVKQFELICSIIGKTQDELQLAWQDYLLNIKVPPKWMGFLRNEISKGSNSVDPGVFTCSEIPASERAIDNFNRQRQIDIHLFR